MGCRLGICRAHAALWSRFGDGWHAYYRASTPDLLFEDTFQIKPPPGTVVLHGYACGGGVWLAFRTDHETFDRLRRVKLDRENFHVSQYANSFANPGWWREPGDDGDRWSVENGIERILMTWEPNGLAQYYWESID